MEKIDILCFLGAVLLYIKIHLGRGGGQVFDIGEAKNILGGGGFLQTF